MKQDRSPRDCDGSGLRLHGHDLLVSQRQPVRREFSRWGLLILVMAPAAAGCYQPTIAPPIEYNQEDAELLSEELGKMDWE